jgi:hypothetical protein
LCHGGEIRAGVRQELDAWIKDHLLRQAFLLPTV